MVPVGRDGDCRLCYRHRPSLISPANSNCSGQQLFFAGMFRLPSAEPKSRPLVARRRLQPIRPVAHRQLVLLEVPIDMEAGLRKGFPPPKDPVLAAALWEVVRHHAARRGWSRAVTERAQRGVRILIGLQHTPGAPIKASDVVLLSRVGISVRGVTEVLAEAGMLEDDSVPAIVRWFPVHIAELPAEMRA
jgi:hypothetical protein